jgi:hypothetical protein
MAFCRIIRRLLRIITIASSNRMPIRLHLIAWIISLFVIRAGVSAQSTEVTDSTQTPRGPYAFVVTVGSGLSYYSTHLGVPAALEQAHVSRFGLPATLRVMWHPDHRLRVGLETGWTTMYTYRGQVTGEPVRMHVAVVPVLALFSMPLAWLSGTERSFARRMAATVGTGVYLNHSRLDYAGTVQATTNSLGWMAACSYAQPIGRRIRIAGEVKWYDAVTAENAAFVVEIQFVWRAFSW